LSNSPKKIIVDLLRHGQPEGGEVLRGRVDHALSELGWQQMSQVAPATGSWTEVISSPLQRCRIFAEHLAKTSSIPLQVKPDWQEIDYGDWDGLPLSQWREVAAQQFREFRHDMSKLVPPGGEAYLLFRDRVLSALQQLAEKPDGSHILLVTHGGVMRVVLPTVLGMPLNRSNPLHIPFACLSRIELTFAQGKLDSRFVFHNKGENQNP